MRWPSDPHLTDAEGAARFARDVMRHARKRPDVDLDAAAYWAARCAAHWAQRSLTWRELTDEAHD